MCYSSYLKHLEYVSPDVTEERKVDLIKLFNRERAHPLSGWDRHHDELVELREKVNVIRRDVRFYKLAVLKYFRSSVFKSVAVKFRQRSKDTYVSRHCLWDNEDFQKFLARYKRMGVKKDLALSVLRLYCAVLTLKAKMISDIQSSYYHRNYRQHDGEIYYKLKQKTTPVLARDLEQKRMGPLGENYSNREVRWVDTLEECEVIYEEQVNWKVPEFDPGREGRRYYRNSDRRLTRVVHAVRSRLDELPGGAREWHGQVTLGAELVSDKDGVKIWRAVWFRTTRENDIVVERGLIGEARGMNGRPIISHSKGTPASCTKMVMRRVDAEFDKWETDEYLKAHSKRIHKISESLAKGATHFLQRFGDIELRFKDARHLGYCAPGTRSFLDRAGIDYETLGKARVKIRDVMEAALRMKNSYELEMAAKCCAVRAVREERRIEKAAELVAENEDLAATGTEV